jgi:hypothetical protein
MPTRKLDKAEWRPFCDRMSKVLLGKRAEIEVESLALGSQIEARWLPLLGIAYDPKDDVFEVALEGLDHLIPKPAELYVEAGPTGIAALEIVDREGVRQIVRLRDPLMLPAASSAG